MTPGFTGRILLLGLGLLLANGAEAQTPAKNAKPAGKNQPAKMVLEPRAMDLLKTTSARLAAAKSMEFSAVVSYEYPSQLGPPILYTVRYDVAMRRPDKLRVITPGDGPASEFYYDGKSMMAYAPAENLVAVADAPPTIQGALKAAFEAADIYYPFTDIIVDDPYAALTDGAILAFYIGPSEMVGGTKTEMVAWANPDVFLQIWIGADDKLPRRIRATYSADPLGLRHEMDLSNWKLDFKRSSGWFCVAEGLGRTAHRVQPAIGRIPASRSEGPGRREAAGGRAKITMRRRNVMRMIAVIAGSLLLSAAWHDPASAWSSANRYGGTTTHTYGQTSHTNMYGGSSYHSYGQGTEHTNAYGGSTAHAYGGGTEHTNVYGGTTTGAYGEGATHTYASGGSVYHPPGYGAYPGYPAYHPPVAVPYYSAAGCYGCAAAAGAIAGVTVGAAVASANAAAASVPAPAPVYVMGVNYAKPPSGCITPSVQGQTYYLCGNTWLKPTYGANGLYYQVVPTP